MKKVLGTIALFLIFGSANAALMTDSVDNGWYKDDGTHNPDSSNVYTGNFEGAFYRSFYSFDLSSLSGNIGSASIVFFGGNGENTLFFESTLDLWDVSDISSIAAGGQSVAGFIDLGSGTSYGSQAVAACGNCTMPELTLNLSAAAVADINAAMGSGLFGVGSSLRFDPGPGAALWSASAGVPAAKLVLNVAAVPEPSVPEPSVLALFAVGLLGMGFSRRRKS